MLAWVRQIGPLLRLVIVQRKLSSCGSNPPPLTLHAGVEVTVGVIGVSVGSYVWVMVGVRVIVGVSVTVGVFDGVGVIVGV